MREGLMTTQITEPYAQALMSLAQTHDLTDRFGEDVAAILSTLQESEDLRQFLTNPLAKADSKKGVLRQVFGEQLHPFVLNFVLLLADRRRINFLHGICKQYQALLRELRQTVLAQVTSAVELRDDQKQAVRERVIAMTGARQVELETSLAPELIGGVVIKVGSQVIDASLRGQLRRISLRLLSSM
jgi:F-type H+-transporting ATPase subunit delta